MPFRAVRTQDVLDMLEVRSSDGLPSWVAARLGEWFPAARRRVLRVFSAKAARIQGRDAEEGFAVCDVDTNEAPSARGIDADLAKVLAEKPDYRVVPGPDGGRLLATIEAGGEIRYVLELSGDIAGATHDQRFSSLLAIAARYFQRLVDGETDPLTRLANRAVFHAHVEAGIRRWTASDRRFYFAILDVDHFKKVNDTWGHLYGDEILVHFANLLRRSFRAGDLLYRFGGEEFVLIYGVDAPHSGRGTLERFRKTVEEYRFPGVGGVTVSIGYTGITDPDPPATLIERADSAVYYAKAHGRNRVCCWEDLVASGELKATVPAKADVTLF